MGRLGGFGQDGADFFGSWTRLLRRMDRLVLRFAYPNSIETTVRIAVRVIPIADSAVVNTHRLCDDILVSILSLKSPMACSMLAFRSPIARSTSAVVARYFISVSMPPIHRAISISDAIFCLRLAFHPSRSCDG